MPGFGGSVGQSNPGQVARLLWFLAFFLSPMAGVAYVSTFEHGSGGREALIHLALILVVSLIVSVVSIVTAPLQPIDGDGIRKIARANLFFAIVDTIFFAVLLHDPSSAPPACHLDPACRIYPLAWLALAGMHYGYAIDAYIIKLRSAY